MKPIFFLLLPLLFLACPDDDMPAPGNAVLLPADSGVLVLNEGPFRQSLGSLSFYHYVDQHVEQNLFRQVNGYSLGDILNSALVVDTNLLLLVNNSSIVERVGQGSLRSNSTLDLPSPRHAVRLPDGRTYISDFTAQEIHVLAAEENLRKSNAIPLTGWSENLLFINDRVYVSNPFRSHLYVIDPSLDIVTDSIELEPQCGALVADGQGRLWTICMGDNILDNQARLYRLSTDGQQIDSWPLAANGQSRLLFVAATEEIWLLTFDGLYRWPTNLLASDQLENPWLARAGNWYALGRQPDNGDIYLGDALDFQRPGMVFRFTSAGVPLDSFEVGIGPNSFVFY